ncbi:hypothetical protein Y032_0007g3322 [Ancylostoma ceylanicum]|uniref:Uncharacterized protein n=1 Tax=Ancylostoma ceylanicum TaxID=53326 RepID=A0A016VMU9_9BILA|nr:hypothetical protein Y032_0007g3322 [Ancylostoma ceylanicum]
MLTPKFIVQAWFPEPYASAQSQDRRLPYSDLSFYWMGGRASLSHRGCIGSATSNFHARSTTLSKCIRFIYDTMLWSP